MHRKIFGTHCGSPDGEEEFSLKDLRGQYSLYYANNFMSVLMIRNPRFEITLNDKTPNIDICVIGCTRLEGPISVTDPVSVTAKVSCGQLSVRIGDLFLDRAAINIYEAAQARADFFPYFDAMPLPIFAKPEPKKRDT